MSAIEATNHTEIHREFQRKLEECPHTAACGRPFVPVGRLQDWFRSSCRPGVTHIDQYEIAAYRIWRTPNLPTSPDTFEEGPECCLLVFCILLMINRGELIHHFKEESKVDQRLPFSLEEVSVVLNNAGVSNADSLYRDFDDKQHRFCSPKFYYRGNKHWNEDVVIPICSKMPINEGETAKLWHIDVPEEFVNGTLKQKSKSSRFNAGSDAKPDLV